MITGLFVFLLLALVTSCAASKETLKILQEIWAFWILAILGSSTLIIFGAKHINVVPSLDRATNVGISINTEGSIPSRILRFRIPWFLKAGGWDDVRIGFILCLILALPGVLRQVPEVPGNVRGASITVFFCTLVFSFFTAALPEELLFRGFLQTFFARRLKSTNQGLIFASLAFGLYHVPNNLQLFSGDCRDLLPWQLLGLAVTSVLLGHFSVGLFLGFAFSSRGSLVIPVMVHTWINTIGMFLQPDSSSQVMDKLEAWGLRDKALYVDVLVLIMAVFLGVLILKILRKLLREMGTNLNAATPEQLIGVLATKFQNSDTGKSAQRAYALTCLIIACRPLASIGDLFTTVDLLEDREALAKLLQVDRAKLEELLQEIRGELEELEKAGLLVSST